MAKPPACQRRPRPAVNRVTAPGGYFTAALLRWRHGDKTHSPRPGHIGPGHASALRSANPPVPAMAARNRAACSSTATTRCGAGPPPIWTPSGKACGTTLTCSRPRRTRAVLAKNTMPGAQWFPGAQVNYVRQVLRHVDAAHAAGLPAIISRNEKGNHRELAWPELRRQVASLALHLKAQGVQPGDRVAAYLPNVPEAMIAFLATASIGACGASARRHGHARGARPLPPDRAQGAHRRGRRELRRARPRPHRRAGRAARGAAQRAARGAAGQSGCFNFHSWLRKLGERYSPK